MLSLQKAFSQFEQIALRWIEDLNLYTEEQFLRKPDELQWSIGQVYVHLIQSAENFHLKQIQLCSNKNGKEMNGGKKLPGVISFTLGAFPPIRIKVPPSPSYTPQQPKNKEEVLEKLKKLVYTVKEIVPMVEKAPSEQKTEHPAFGYLNAREWYQLILMHYHHHRRQQKRLNHYLGITI
ncbi:MAG: DinB family protein [Bacteroidota bacterium]